LLNARSRFSSRRAASRFLAVFFIIFALHSRRLTKIRANFKSEIDTIFASFAFAYFLGFVFVSDPVSHFFPFPLCGLRGKGKKRIARARRPPQSRRPARKSFVDRFSSAAIAEALFNLGGFDSWITAPAVSLFF